MNLPDASNVLDLIEAFRRSKTMFTAVSMGVFDLLHEGPSNAAALAVSLDANGDAMERLLDACAALGLLVKQDGLYRNTPAAETYLCSASPHTMSGYIRYSDQALYAMWGNLGDAIREGTPRWAQTFGLDGPIFTSFFRSDEAMRDFVRGMHGFGMLTSPKVAAAFDLSGFHRLVDLGGATGHLAIACCERYPNLHGVVFDLERVTAMAREQVALSTAGGRLEVQAGDFFESQLPPADLYAVGRILHDWSDEKIERLLHRVYDSLPAGGALLVAEKLLAEDGVGPVPANMQSLNMLVVTEGKERSLGQYTRLLRAAGFAQVEGRRTGVALDAVLARKSAIPPD
ncbi:MAG TPA: class I SAM-dependent methyltransferase [Candidatus Sulfopaludibacter sp.]|jgi:acetylserotonin N-methyltransferase|nr:class I SAM-dependent methyltransferase [Candidatus Sulfopaludibacter sp.]